MKLSELNVSKQKKLKRHSTFTPLFKLETKLNLKALIIFTLVSIVLLAISVATFSVIETMPGIVDTLKEIFGEEVGQMLIEMMGLSDYSSYFTINVGQQWGLVALIYSSFLGYAIVADNLKNKSAQMLYSLNVSRNKVLGTKLLVLILNVLIFNLLNGAVGLAMSLAMGYQISIINYAIYTLFAFVISLQSGLIMFALATLFTTKLNTAFSIAIPILLYVFATIGMGGGDLVAFTYLSPISIILQTGSNIILNTGFAGVNLSVLIVWTIIPLLLLPLGFAKFNKKDLV